MNPALLVAPAAVVPVVVAVVVAVVVVVVVVVVAVLVSRAGSRRWQAQLDAARAEVEALGIRLDALSGSPEAEQPVADRREFVITSLPEGTAARRAASGPAAGLVARPEGSLPTAGQFASVAVGKSLVRVLSFGYGVRRALSAENRNRIRFEMSREVKRSRRQRRRDLKEAKRHLRQVTTESTEDAA